MSRYKSDKRIKAALLASLLAGIGSIVLGVAGDLNDWWKDLSFVTNLLSSVATALVGFPLALVVVQRISERYERDAEHRRLESYAVRMVDKLDRELRRQCRAPDRVISLEDLLRTSYRMPPPMWVVTEAIGHWRAAFPGDGEARSLSVLNEAAPNWDRLVTIVLEFDDDDSEDRFDKLKTEDIADLRSILKKLQSPQFAGNFRLSADELTRLVKGRKSNYTMTSKEMLRAVQPIAKLCRILQLLKSQVRAYS